MLSHLIDLDPDARLDPENAGWEFRYYIFQSLPKLSSADVVQVCEILSGENVIRPDPNVQQPFVQQLRSPLTVNELRTLQGQDNQCTTLIRMLKNNKLDPIAYSLHKGVLYRRDAREDNRSRRYTYPGPPKASFKQFYKQPTMNQDIMDCPEPIQPSEGCITEKESRKMYYNIVGTATRVSYTRLLQ